MKTTFLAKFLASSMTVTLMAGSAFAAAQSNPAPASAATANAVSLTAGVMVEKTVTENGVSKVQLIEPKVVVPGDRLVYTMRYRNEGAVPATNYVMTNPLPAAVVLAPEGIDGAEVSVDGGKTWGLLSAAKVSDGKGGLRAAAAGDVTHLRWTVAQIAPGATGQVEYHAIVR